MAALTLSFYENKQCKDSPPPCEKPATISFPFSFALSNYSFALHINGCSILIIKYYILIETIFDFLGGESLIEINFEAVLVSEFYIIP